MMVLLFWSLDSSTPFRGERHIVAEFNSRTEIYEMWCGYTANPGCFRYGFLGGEAVCTKCVATLRAAMPKTDLMKVASDVLQEAGVPVEPEMLDLLVAEPLVADHAQVAGVYCEKEIPLTRLGQLQHSGSWPPPPRCTRPIGHQGGCGHNVDLARHREEDLAARGLAERRAMQEHPPMRVIAPPCPPILHDDISASVVIERLYAECQDHDHDGRVASTPCRHCAGIHHAVQVIDGLRREPK
jgi:hypothetical protein